MCFWGEFEDLMPGRLIKVKRNWKLFDFFYTIFFSKNQNLFYLLIYYHVKNILPLYSKKYLHCSLFHYSVIQLSEEIDLLIRIGFKSSGFLQIRILTLEKMVCEN